MNFIEDSLRILKEKGYKVTGPRVAVLQILDVADRPLSPYDIEELIPENIPINVVTIYRVLDLFEKQGIVHRLLSKHGFVRCDFETKPGCHHFAICNSCDKVSEFVQGKECTTEKSLPGDLDFKDLQHFVEMAGTCGYCSLKSPQK